MAAVDPADVSGVTRTTTNGDVIGHKDLASIEFFFGIPVADDPSGANRFKAPQAVSSWASPLETVTEKTCAHTGPNEDLFPTFYGQEDCISVDVITTTAATGLPVMVCTRSERSNPSPCRSRPRISVFGSRILTDSVPAPVARPPWRRRHGSAQDPPFERLTNAYYQRRAWSAIAARRYLYSFTSTSAPSAPSHIPVSLWRPATEDRATGASSTASPTSSGSKTTSQASVATLTR